MIVELVKECSGDVIKAAKHMGKPVALVRMAVQYARAYPEEIAACLRLHAETTLDAAKDRNPAIEAL